MLWLVLQIVGGMFITWHVGRFLIEVFRCLYWAVWETVAVARNSRDRVTLTRVIKSLWFRFTDELTGDFAYDNKSCRHYHRGFWPWNDRSWH
jgi:hypothetical protein